MTAPLPTVDVYLTSSERVRAMAHDARVGLSSQPKSLPPVWFYDEHGSELFDQITRLDEYYVTRAERSILALHAPDIAKASDADTLVELGSGTSEKTHLLLDAMATTDRLRRFVPVDVSEETLRSAAATVAAAYGIEVNAVVGDFARHLGQIRGGGQRLIAFFGSTIGNFTPPQRLDFLRSVNAIMAPADRLLLGTDLVKDRGRLIAAYNDAAGVTAQFNLNVLAVLNRDLQADFDIDGFEHDAVWNEIDKRIEMRLRSRRRQSVHLRAIDLEIAFAEGEEMLTEISSKFTPEQVRRELSEAGFGIVESWRDPGDDFLLTLAQPLSGGTDES
jgi:L-histidine N-alpha-methyltransferase